MTGEQIILMLGFISGLALVAMNYRKDPDSYVPALKFCIGCAGTVISGVLLAMLSKDTLGADSYAIGIVTSVVATITFGAHIIRLWVNHYNSRSRRPRQMYTPHSGHHTIAHRVT